MSLTTHPASTADDTDRPRRVRLRWFALLSGVFGGLLAVVTAQIVAQTGDLVYAIDDPYIHLALADTFARTGTWGLTPGTFESASSAPLWTLGLSLLVRVPGVPTTWWPLLVNVVAGLWLLWTLAGLPVTERLGRRRPLLVALALLPIALGMVPLALLGMEHLLHAALVAQALVLLAAVVRGRGSSRTVTALLALVAVGCLVRFETAFVAAGLAVGAVWATVGATDRRGREAGAAPDGTAAAIRSGPAGGRWTGGVALAAALVVVAAVALGAHALWNTGHGQYPVPNSVAAKSAFGQGFPVDPGRVVEQATEDPAFDLVLVAAVGALATAGWRRAARRAAAPLVAATVAALGVLTLATVSAQSLDRYQSFAIVAMAVGLLTFATDLPADARPRWLPGPDRARTSALVLAAVLLALAALRLPVLVEVADSAGGIHRQQEQMARFLAEHYDGQAIMVNDLGWVAFLHDGPVLDLAGLGSHAVVRAQKEGRLDRAFVEEQVAAQGTEVAVVFERYFGGAIPSGWVRVGRWCLDGPAVTNGDRCVAWYAPADRAGRLHDELQSFTASLPPGVTATLDDLSVR